MEPPAARPAAPPPAPASAFPRLARLSPDSPHVFARPAKRINEGADVQRFLASRAYRDVGAFVLQLTRAVCPRRRAAAVQAFTLRSPRADPPSVRRLRALLDAVAALTADAPPGPGPRRFGNVAFRAWHALLEDRAAALLREFLPPHVLAFGAGAAAEGGREGEGEGEGDIPASALDELAPYFLGGFGSAQRLDYGTGHELSFLAFLGGLWKLGAFADGGPDDDVERSIVLGVIEP